MKPDVFEVGSRVRKVGGSYEATGTVVAAFKTRAGKQRYVFEFNEFAGMLHIFNHEQLESIASHDHKIQVTRIYGARGTDVFAEGVLSTQGDLIKIDGSRDMELTPDEAARIGKELIRLARRGGWIDPEEDDGK